MEQIYYSFKKNDNLFVERKVLYDRQSASIYSLVPSFCVITKGKI
jgi:hypothetical protein